MEEDIIRQANQCKSDANTQYCQHLTYVFTAFSKAYQDELAQHQDEGLRLAQRANKQTVTLLYGAKDTEQNHALVLADWLRQL